MIANSKIASVLLMNGFGREEFEASMLRKTRRAVLLIYVVIAGALLGGDYIWLRSSWVGHVDSVEKSLVADSSLVTNFIQANLIDTSKVLDFARTRIIESDARRRLDPEAIHQILDETLQSISFSVSSDLRGLLFFIDSNARMVAQSGQFPAPAYDFSDRLYFRSLVAAPDAKFAVGNMLVAKTTGQLVFHISMPVRNDKGRLIGILVQQIHVRDVAAVIREFLEYPDAVIVTRLVNDKIVFAFPVDATPPVIDGVCAEGSEKGSFVAKAAGDSDERRLVGYSFSRVFGLCTSATLPERAVFTQALRAHEAELSGVVVVFLLISGLFATLLGLLRRLEEEIELSNRDPLTGLRNRRFLDAIYESYFRDAIRNNQPLSVLFVDIDHFKQVNDRYGHAAGDAVLISLGEVLQDRVRRPLDVCCRWGGEEFVVLLPDTALDGALGVATEIWRHVRVLVINSGTARLSGVTVSIGVVSRTPCAGEDMNDLIALADKAMLQAKERGRDRIVIYEDLAAGKTVGSNSVTNVSSSVTDVREPARSEGLNLSGTSDEF